LPIGLIEPPLLLSPGTETGPCGVCILALPSTKTQSFCGQGFLATLYLIIIRFFPTWISIKGQFKSLTAQNAITSSVPCNVSDILLPMIPEGAIELLWWLSTQYLIEGIVDIINAGESLV
jgi:hypothetical protein